MEQIKVLLIVVIFLLISSNSHAQTTQNFAKQNTWEVGGSVSFSYTENVSNGITSDNGRNVFKLYPYVGYFIIDGLEIGIIPAIELISYGGSTSSNSFAIYVAPSYNFYTKSIAYPYVQGAFGYNDVSSGGSSTSASGIAWALEGGVKINIAGSSLLKIGLDYSQKTLNGSHSSDDRDGVNTLSFVAGFNVFFY
jgi:hypothetical protein